MLNETIILQLLEMQTGLEWDCCADGGLYYCDEINFEFNFTGTELLYTFTDDGDYLEAENMQMIIKLVNEEKDKLEQHRQQWINRKEQQMEEFYNQPVSDMIYDYHQCQNSNKELMGCHLEDLGVAV